MRVILLSDVPKLGKKGDIKEVADGYARNFLLARGLAVVESSASKKILAEQKHDEEVLDQKKRAEAEELKKVLAAKSLVFKVKANEGKVSGSVSGKQIEEELKKEGIVIDKRNILGSEPLNSLGTFDVKIKLYKDVIGQIKVVLEED